MEGQGCVQVRVEQHRAAEVPHQVGDFGAERLPVEQRQVEEEPPGVTPGGDDLGEGGGEGRGGVSPSPAGGREQCRLVVGAEPVVEAAGAGERGVVGADGGERVDGRRQPGGARQPVQALAPPGGVPFAFGRAPGVVLREVVAVVEGERGRRVVGALVEASQVGEEDAQAQRVAGHHVQADPEPGAAVREQAQGGAEDLAGGEVGARVGAAFAQRLQYGVGLFGRVGAQVVEDQRRARLAVALASLVVEDGPQHAVPPHQFAQGGVEPGRVDVVAVEFDVEVRVDAAERLPVLASDPVGVLHRRQGEGARLRPRRGDGPRRGGPGAARGAGEQGRPCREGRDPGEVLEGDRAVGAPPGARQGHQHQ